MISKSTFWQRGGILNTLKNFKGTGHLRKNRVVVTKKSYCANSNVVSTLPRSGKLEVIKPNSNKY